MSQRPKPRQAANRCKRPLFNGSRYASLVGTRMALRSLMAHVVTSKCQGCKFTDCVEVCPVACFYELEDRLVIHPEDCIDCTACVSVCPVEAIYADGEVPTEFQADIELNAARARSAKEGGQAALLQTKAPLPTAVERRAAMGY